MGATTGAMGATGATGMVLLPRPPFFAARLPPAIQCRSAGCYLLQLSAADPTKAKQPKYQIVLQATKAAPALSTLSPFTSTSSSLKYRPGLFSLEFLSVLKKPFPHFLCFFEFAFRFSYICLDEFVRSNWYQVTGDKDVKEGTSKGNVTSISVSDDTQAQTVSKVPLTQNHIFVSFSSCSNHPFQLSDSSCNQSR